MNDDEILAVLGEAADAVATSLNAAPDWRSTGQSVGQYFSDVAADNAAQTVLREAGLSVFSEESGWNGAVDDLVVVLDPVDGSTNASRRISWWATSMCVLDQAGPRVALVDDLVHQSRFMAVRGQGHDKHSGCQKLDSAIVGLNGLPAAHLGWAQCRALGAAALDMCAVGDGRLDAYIDCSGPGSGLAPWDYLGATLICREAGAVVHGFDDRPLEDLSEPLRRPLVAAATPELADELLRRYLMVGPAHPVAP